MLHYRIGSYPYIHSRVYESSPIYRIVNQNQAIHPVTHNISLIDFHILIISSHSLIPPHHPSDVFQDLYGFIISPLMQYARLAWTSYTFSIEFNSCLFTCRFNDQMTNCRSSTWYTNIIKDNKQCTYETHTCKTNDRKLQKSISIPYNITLTIKTECNNLFFSGYLNHYRL